MISLSKAMHNKSALAGLRIHLRRRLDYRRKNGGK